MAEEIAIICQPFQLAFSPQSSLPFPPLIVFAFFEAFVLRPTHPLSAFNKSLRYGISLLPGQALCRVDGGSMGRPSHESCSSVALFVAQLLEACCMADSPANTLVYSISSFSK